MSRPAFVWYECVRWFVVFYTVLRGGIRVTGRENLPRHGGYLLVSNHTSFLDPPLLGIAVPRHLRYVARSSLFKPILGPFLRSIGGFSLDREAGGTGGLKETLRLLKAGWCVLIFPEGTRSLDGRFGPLKPGFAAMTRARVPIVPAAIAGAYQAWPPGQFFPATHPIRIHFDRPILPETLRTLDTDAVISLVRERMEASLEIACQGLERDMASE